MKIIYIVLFFIFISMVLHAQDKSGFDIDPAKLHKAGVANKLQSGNFYEVKNDRLDMTLIPGGYFTLGTSYGMSSSQLDDNCQLTFGHPYAMTSYPVFSVDGTWYKLDEYFTDPSDIVLQKNSDTLRVTAVKSGLLSVTFYMYFQQSDKSIQLAYKIKNLDAQAHSIGMGLMYDPAIGKNGDGSIALSGAFLKESKIFQSPELLPEFILWEKAAGARGIGASLKFSTLPAKLIAGNWNDLYKTQSPDYDYSSPQRIYDLYLKIYWPESSTAPDSEKTEMTSVSLIQPDFSSSLFLRWDLPGYLAMDNNIMFPQSMSTYLEVGKTGTGTVSNGNLKLELSDEISSGILSYSYGSSIPAFQKADFSVKTLYESKTVEAAAKIYDGTTLIDEIRRPVFIPETPVSDSGLVVSIDTLITSKYPKISLTFDVLQKARGTKIANLISDNIFLYENDSRVTNYTFGKDTSGGSFTADIIFAFDVTGSMSNEIDAVKRNIVEFADSLTESGVDYQLGLVTFLDYTENKYPFTKDAHSFQQLIGQQYAHGGDDMPENSLQALMDASRYNFRPNSRRIVIWITDASYHENDAFTKLTKKTVTDSLLVKGIIVHSIGDKQFKSSYYDPIVIATAGNSYDINGNFRDILLDISRVKSVFKYMISYNSTAASQQGSENQIKLKIRFAGLGGESMVSYKTGKADPLGKYFSFYPNPFNPEITFKVSKGDFKAGKIRIYDILGRLIKEFNFTNMGSQNLVWNARSEDNRLVATGFYIAELTLTGADKSSYVETAKILYLK
ncbi:MAG: VWA domain-containing protein [Ignavibacteriales bacterium]